MVEEADRSRAARRAAESALIRVVHHYGARPEFVVLGGLVPELLCSNSPHLHAGTTDVDVQVNLEIASGAVNTQRLEYALRNADFEPENERIWRWKTDEPAPRTVVKFELLADLDNEPAGSTITFEGCDRLGAVNLRGTRFASRDVEVRELRAKIAGDLRVAEVNVTGIAGFLLAKCAAAHSRRKSKDWYDLAFVILHNDAGGPDDAARAVVARFESELPSMRTALDDLAANFQTPSAQGPSAYAEQMMLDAPELERRQLLADAVLAVTAFHKNVRR
jgi:hypothetical protein